MATTINVRNPFVQVTIWAVLAAVLFILYWSMLPPEFAFIRASVMIILAALVHYCNGFLFFTFFVRKKFAAYIFSSILLLAALSGVRFFIESSVFPAGAKPAVFQLTVYRPFIFIISGTSMWFLSTFFLYVLHATEKERYMLRLVNVHNEARLQYLYSQINPHFLFNAMNNIYSLVVTGSDKASEMFLTLSDLMRYSVYQKPGLKVAVSDEVHQIEMLIKLFNLKNDTPYNISFKKNHVQGIIEPMILMPLAENCLKHCDFDINDKAHVIMELDVKDGALLFTTENSYIDKPTQPDGGIGLKNIRERLELIYGKNYQLDLRRNGNIFKVQLSLQWNN